MRTRRVNYYVQHKTDADWADLDISQVSARIAETVMQAEAPPPAQPGDNLPADATIRGESPAFSIQSLLQFLSSNKKTGTLRVETVCHSFVIELREGAIRHATYSPRPVEEQLGSILMERDIVQADTLARLIDHCRRNKQHLGLALHAEQAVSMDDLRSALEHQVTLLFQRLFSIERSVFAFYESDVDHPELHVRMGLMELLLESARAVDEKARGATRTDSDPSRDA